MNCTTHADVVVPSMLLRVSLSVSPIGLRRDEEGEEGGCSRLRSPGCKRWHRHAGGSLSNIQWDSGNVYTPVSSLCRGWDHFKKLTFLKSKLGFWPWFSQKEEVSFGGLQTELRRKGNKFKKV